MAAPRWIHESRARRSVYDSLPNKSSDESWLWYGMGLAGKPLSQLQSGPWQLTPHDIHDHFGAEVYTGTCDFIYELKSWQDAQKREKSLLDWQTVYQAIEDAKGNDREYNSTHVKQAREDLESEGSRKRKSRDEESSIVVNTTKQVRHGIDTPPESPQSPIKSFKETTSSKGTSSKKDNSVSLSDAAGRSKRSSAQKANLMTARMYRMYPSLNGPSPLARSRRKDRKSISAMSPTKLSMEMTEDDAGATNSPDEYVQRDIAQAVDAESKPPELDDQELKKRPAPAVGPQASANISQPRSAPLATTSEPRQDSRTPMNASESGSTHPTPALEVALDQLERPDAPESECSAPVHAAEPIMNSRMSINTSEAESTTQSYHDRILHDLRSPTSLSAETLDFFLRDLLPTKFTRVFDPGNLPLGNDLTSWPQSPPLDLDDLDIVLVPLCVEHRWVLFVLQLKLLRVTIMDSFKTEPEDKLLQNIAAKLGASIKSAAAADNTMPWEVFKDERSYSHLSAREDFGIFMFVLCLKIAAGEVDYPPNIDTSLWRTILSALLSKDPIDDVMNDWLAKLRSRFETDLSIANDAWIAESLPGFHATKLRLETIPQLERHLAETLEISLPDMERMMADLGHVASTWLSDTSNQISGAEATASAFQQHMATMLQLQSRDVKQANGSPAELSELTLSLEGFYYKKQGRVQKLRREEIRIQQMQNTFISIREIVQKCTKLIRQFQNDINKDNDESRATILRIGKAEVNDKARELEESKKELAQKEKLLADARRYIGLCEKTHVRRHLWT